jgi:translocation protein SEC63
LYHLLIKPTSHPDKVKPTANDSIESIANKFVEITKAYKSYVFFRPTLYIYLTYLTSLTNEAIRKNWELYGHPDGRQEMSVGIALPQWVIEGKNNIWVLGFYGVIFGGGLPALVGKWWFGSRRRTKDGVQAKTAAAFFKSLKEESEMDDVVGTLGKAFSWEGMAVTKAAQKDELEGLESRIRESLGSNWTQILELAEAGHIEHGKRKKALILLYSHLLRFPIPSSLRHGPFSIL